MTRSPPSHEEQIKFLTKLQRIFTEGDFTATYKFALLITLAELAVEFGSDDGNELVLENRQIGLRFIALYWKQSLPYSAGRAECTPGVLVQNIGAQAAVISEITRFRDKTNSKSLNVAMSHPEFNKLVTKVTSTVSNMPLTYLQNFGGIKDEFIYERHGANKVLLKPGVAYCLRRFNPLIQQLARNDWLTHIKTNRRNTIIIGEADDLESFLFESSRKSLELIGNSLRKLDGSKCFYCGNTLQSADVDHFIPFSLYPRDIAQNFVLAHPKCNRSKSDTLAALEHLERWLDRINVNADNLSEIGSDSGFISDPVVIGKVGAWAYTNAHQANAQAWISPNHYTSIDHSYSQCFEVRTAFISQS